MSLLILAARVLSSSTTPRGLELHPIVMAVALTLSSEFLKTFCLVPSKCLVALFSPEALTHWSLEAPVAAVRYPRPTLAPSKSLRCDSATLPFVLTFCDLSFMILCFSFYLLPFTLPTY